MSHHASGGEAMPSWELPAHSEPRWPPTLAVLVALVIYARLPDRLTPGPQLLLPALELVLLIPMVVSSPFESPAVRATSVASRSR